MSNELIKRFFSSIILLPILIFITFKGSFLFNIFLIICLIFSFTEWINISKTILLKIIGSFFLIISFYSVYKLRNDFYGEYILIFFILLICISTDLGGYIFGKIFKGPKLTKISPNKTFTGVFGSYFLSLVLSISYYYLLEKKFTNNSFFEITIIIFLISTVSQLGDLFLSYFKRLSNIKDTGKLIPGHGGILDRIDGMIFAFPLAYLLFLFNFLNIKI